MWEMFRAPQRLSLVAQTAAILKEHIATRPANESLASERELSHQLGVSRMTLRAALSKLQGEGLVRSSQGCRRTIARPKKKRGVSTKNRDVVVLSPVPMQAMESRILFWIDELREALGKENYKLDFFHQHNCYSRNPAAALEDLARRLQPAVWLLYLSTQTMQEWFDSRGLPAVIPGSRYEGVRLPSVDVNYRATCQHAVGCFVARGHRCLALLNPKSVSAGDIESRIGFQQAGEAQRVEAIVSEHDGTVTGICSALDRLLQQSRRPTAFLVSRPTHALTALGHLIRRGVNLPKDTLLVARDHDSFLEHVVPAVACYRADPVVFARKLSRVVMEIASGGDVRSRDYKIIPRLIPGETLA